MINLHKIKITIKRMLVPPINLASVEAFDIAFPRASCNFPTIDFDEVEVLIPVKSGRTALYEEELAKGETPLKTPPCEFGMVGAG